MPFLNRPRGCCSGSAKKRAERGDPGERGSKRRGACRTGWPSTPPLGNLHRAETNVMSPSMIRGRKTRGRGATAPPRVASWPEPRPVPRGRPAVPPFDAALLPEALAPWVADVAERVQCPPDFVAVGVLAAAAAVIGRKVAIRPKRHDDWAVVPNLWGVAVGPPGL